MTISLITSRSRAALMQTAYSLLTDSLNSGSDAIWILPDHRSARQESSRTSGRTPVGIKTTLFSRLLAELWQLYGDGRRIVDRETRDLLLQAALAAEPSLGALAGSDALRSALSQALSSGDMDGSARPGGPFAPINGVLSYYRTLLHDSNLVEECDAAQDLALPQASAGTTVVVSGFSELTGLQLALLERLAAAASVHVLVQYDEDAPAAHALGRMADAVCSLGAPVRVLPVHSEEPVLAPLAFQLLKGDIADIPAGSVRFLEVETFEMEHASVARVVRERLDAGIRPERIAISGWSIAGSAARIAEELAAHGIAAEVDVAVPLARTHFGRAFIAMLDAVSGANRVAVSAALSSPFTPIAREDADAFDARWRSRPPAATQAFIDDVNRRCGRTADLLRDARSASRFEVGPAWADALEELASRMFAVGAEGRPGHLVREDGAAHAAIVSAINAAAGLGAAADQARFRRALGEQKVATGGAVRGEGVLITEVRQLRNRLFDTVVLTGLDAGATDPAAEPGLAARIARAYGGPERTNPQVRQFGELFLALLSVEDQAIFTRTAHDLGSDPERASVVYNELVSRTGVTSEEIERVELEIPDFGAGIGRGARGTLTTREAVDVIGVERAHSVTALESYASCPYKWFITRALSPKSIDEDADTLLHGSIAHEALRIIHARAMEETRERRVSPANLEAVRGWVPTALEEAYESKSARPMDPQDRQWIGAMARRIQEMLVWDAGFADELKPAHLEWAFSDEDLGGVRLKGTVDRIDETPTHIVITDYKSGDPSSRDAIRRTRRIQPLLYGLVASRKLRKPLAATVFRKIADMRANGIEAEGALSLPITSAKIAGPAERMTDDLKWALEIAEEAAAGIRSGIIRTTPSEDACAYCSAAEFCEVAQK